MGIRHLETFIKQYVPNGVHQSSIVDECLYFRCQHGFKPTLVFDLMGLVNLLSSDSAAMLCGGQNKNRRDELVNILQRLSSLAELVFFEDGPVISNKIQTWLHRQNEKYTKMIEVIDKINRSVPLAEIIAKTHNLPTVTSFLTVIEKTAAEFGRLIVTVTKECDAELAQYANNNPSVLAVIADDSDFLIFSGNWRYLSMKHLNMNTFVTLEYNKIILRQFLGLDDLQLRVLSTLGGNDIIHYDEVRHFHNQNCGNNAAYKFQWLADFIKAEMPFNLVDVIDWIAYEVLQNTSENTKDRIHESLMQYKTEFDIPDFKDTNPLLHLCREKYFDFTFSILQQMPKNFTCSFYDLRQQKYSELFETVTKLFCKQIGIILQHKNQKISYEVRTKRNHNENFQEFYVDPNYPNEEVPPLLEFLNRQNFPKHDKLRFKLLKWIVSDIKLQNYDLSAIPTNYLHDVLTLTWLTSCDFISTVEADLILLSIKHVELDLLPHNLQAPPVLHPRAFHVAFHFTKFHMALERCFEVTGLKESMTKLLNFDGFLFHKMYLDMVYHNFNPTPLLCDLQLYRIYQ